MRMRRQIFAFLGICFLWPLPGLAERESVEYSIAAGYAGTVRNGALFPVVVTISNRVASASGDLQLTSRAPGGESEVTYHMPIQTPLNSVKRYECLIRADSGRTPRLTLVFDQALDSEKADINVQTTHAPIILAVDVSQSRLADIAPAHFQIVGPGTLFEDPLAYDGLHALAISGRALLGASPAALDAIKAWTGTGGRLIVVEPLQELPFLRRMEALTQVPASFQSSTGLCRLGSGWIGYMNGTNRTAVSTALRFLDFDADEKFPQSDRRYTSLWKRTGSFGVWGIVGMLWIMAAYLLVIWPVDYFLCKHWRKPIRTWLVFGSAILVFALLAWGLSRLVQVGRMRMVQLTVLDTAPGLARAQSMVWLYSTRNTRYSIECQLDNVHMSAVESMMSAGNLARVDVFNGRSSHMLARIPVFSDKNFDFTGYLPWPEKIDFQGGTNAFSVGIPSTLQVEEAYVVGPAGVAVLTHQDGRWIQTQPAVSLKDAARNMQEVLNGNISVQYHYKHKKTEMPTASELSSYLKALCFTQSSFSRNLDKTFANREKTFAIEDRASTGSLLLLLLKPDSNRFPLTVRGYHPDRMECTLARIPIPSEFNPENFALTNPKSNGEKP